MFIQILVLFSPVLCAPTRSLKAVKSDAVPVLNGCILYPLSSLLSRLGPFPARTPEAVFLAAFCLLLTVPNLPTQCHLLRPPPETIPPSCPISHSTTSLPLQLFPLNPTYKFLTLLLPCHLSLLVFPQTLQFRFFHHAPCFLF